MQLRDDPSISLRILTALSLAVPKGSNGLERRFLEPFAQRLWGRYPALADLEELLESLVVHGAVRPRLGPADMAFLHRFGVLRADVQRVGDHLQTADGRQIEANLADEAAFQQIMAHCLGHMLQGGILTHGASSWAR